MRVCAVVGGPNRLFPPKCLCLCGSCISQHWECALIHDLLALASLGRARHPSCWNPVSWDDATLKSPSVLQMALLRVPSPPQNSAITLSQTGILLQGCSRTRATVALLLCPDAFYTICASGPVLFFFFLNATTECQAEVCLWAVVLAWEPLWPLLHMPSLSSG